jgi:sulfur carrier protein ThiS
MTEIFVEVARTGAAAQTICLNGEHTVMDACKAANISPKSTEAFKVYPKGSNDGKAVKSDYDLNEGDRLVLVKNIEGGLK